MTAIVRKRTRSEAIITHSRRRRSDQTPPMSVNSTIGSAKAASTRPTSLPE